MHARIFDHPYSGIGTVLSSLAIIGQFPGYISRLAYSGRVQIANNIGDCSVELMSGALPTGYTLGVDNATHEVVITWPAYTANSTVLDIPNQDFELGDTGWNKGSGWAVVHNDNPIGGTWNAKFTNQGGDSILSSQTSIPVTPGKSIVATLQVRQGASAAGNAGAAVRLEWLDAGNAVIGFSEGNMVDSASNNAVKPSAVTGSAPAGAASVRLASRAFRRKENLAVWIDSFSWNGAITVTEYIAGTNGTADIPLSLKVTDSAGRTATWVGVIISRAVGDTWTDQATTSGQVALCAACSDGYFLIGGANSKLETSADGVAWTFRTAPTAFPSQGYEGAAYFNNRWYLIKENVEAFEAIDDGNFNFILGKTWSSAPRPQGRTLTVMNGALFLSERLPTTEARLWRMVSVGSWAVIPTGITAGTDHTIDAMCYADNRYVFVTGSGVVFTSDDLLNFTYRQTIALGGGADRMAYTNGVIVLTAGPNHYWRSADNGITWTNVLGSGGNNVVAIDARFLTVGSNSAFTSVDGLTWTFRHAHATDNTMSGIAAGGNRAITFGLGAKIMVSFR